MPARIDGRGAVSALCIGIGLCLGVCACSKKAADSAPSPTDGEAPTPVNDTPPSPEDAGLARTDVAPREAIRKRIAELRDIPELPNDVLAARFPAAKGFDVQITGFGRSTFYHAPNEQAKLEHFKDGFRILCELLRRL